MPRLYARMRGRVSPRSATFRNAGRGCRVAILTSGPILEARDAASAGCPAAGGWSGAVARRLVDGVDAPGGVAGKVAPRLSVPVVANGTGEMMLGAAQDGRVTVIEFFANDCTACERSLPELERCAQAKDVRWISVGVDETPSETRSAARRWRLTRAVAHDTDGRAARAYGIRALPTVVVVDSAGQVVDAHVGPISGERMERKLSALLQ